MTDYNLLLILCVCSMYMCVEILYTCYYEVVAIEMCTFWLAMCSCRSFIAGGHKFVFMVKGPLMFVAVSQGPEYQQQILQQMTYAYNQILSVLTYTQLHNVFQKKPNFDLRFLLQGNNRHEMFEAIILLSVIVVV